MVFTSVFPPVIHIVYIYIFIYIYIYIYTITKLKKMIKTIFNKRSTDEVRDLPP